IGSISGGMSAGTVVNSASLTHAVLTVGGDNSSRTYAGKLSEGLNSGSIRLIKTGSGTLLLYDPLGGNTYSGGTAVLNGTLEVIARSTLSGTTIVKGSLGTGAVAVRDGGELDVLGGVFSLANPLALSGAGTSGGH